MYRQVSPGNTYTEDPEGDERTSIDLIAPGDGIEMAQLGGAHTILNGTSFATPHVTGTAALLQEFAETRIPSPGWGANARRHEVTKAVLMNSADKLIDNRTVMVNGMAVPMSGLLGMQRTVVMQDGVSTWLDSAAYNDGVGEGGGFNPLDTQMGAWPAPKSCTTCYESTGWVVPPCCWSGEVA